MTSLLLIVAANLVVVAWTFRRTQPQSRYDRMVEAARELDATMTERGGVICGLQLRSKGLLGFQAEGKILYRYANGEVVNATVTFG